jgi:Fe-S cluster assembly protein SufD
MLALDAYARAFAALPAAVRTPARAAALEAFLAHGLPDTGEEAWKYTDLAPLAALPVEALTPGAEGVVAMPEHFGDGLDALNAAFAGGGLDLILAPNERHLEPIVAATPGHQRHRLHLQRGAQASLLIDLSGAAVLQTVFADIRLDEGAQLTLVRLADPAAGAHRVSRLKIALGRDASAEVVTVDLGGTLVRHDLDVELLEPGARAGLYGLYAAGAGTHVDNHTRIDHRAPQGSSRESFRGIVGARARAVFNGKIVVHPGAQKTDSEQRVANLLLAASAEVNAKPELEIYADDVKCAHGATFGQLDEQALFYLRSRGLPEPQARSLLIHAFAQEVLDRIAHEPTRNEVRRRFDARLVAAGEAA